jgi:hypothetical protein
MNEQELARMLHDAEQQLKLHPVSWDKLQAMDQAALRLKANWMLERLVIARWRQYPAEHPVGNECNQVIARLKDGTIHTHVYYDHESVHGHDRDGTIWNDIVEWFPSSEIGEVTC